MYGPLHSGQSDDLSCLAVATGQEESKTKSGYGVAILAGSIAGAFVLGAIGAGLVMWCLGRRSGPMTVSRSLQDISKNELTLNHSRLRLKTSTQIHVQHHIAPLPVPSLANLSTQTLLLPWTLTHLRLFTIPIYQALLVLIRSPN